MQSNGSLRPWQEIAKEIIDEQDHDRIAKLTEELSKAIQAQGFGFSYPEEPTTYPSSPAKRPQRLKAAE